MTKKVAELPIYVFDTRNGKSNNFRCGKMYQCSLDALVEDMKKIKGDIMVLGAGGKMGPTLCVLAKNAAKKAGVGKMLLRSKRESI